jgi:hypothetical protein
MAGTDPNAQARLIRLYRRMDAAERTWFRALNELGGQIPARHEAAEQAVQAAVGQALPPANPYPLPRLKQQFVLFLYPPPRFPPLGSP